MAAADAIEARPAAPRARSGILLAGDLVGGQGY
jgi:hypothetical protein